MNGHVVHENKLECLGAHLNTKKHTWENNRGPRIALTHAKPSDVVLLMSEVLHRYSSLWYLYFLLCARLCARHLNPESSCPVSPIQVNQNLPQNNALFWALHLVQCGRHGGYHRDLQLERMAIKLQFSVKRFGTSKMTRCMEINDARNDFAWTAPSSARAPQMSKEQGLGISEELLQHCNAHGWLVESHEVVWRCLNACRS